ncbi:LptA/OstA family protein [Oscillatoria amoena NRMC-F 0135]|nr:LptA/OstA family protein [Oscillatoria amoena NRMC-F 0135]
MKAKNNFFTAAVGSTLMPVVAVLLTALLPLSALAEDKPMPAAAEPRDDEFRDGKAPTVITSEKLRIDTARKIGIFTGDVFVNDSQFTMSADEMRVFFNEKENGIDEVVAQGRVVLTQTGGGGKHRPGGNRLFTRFPKARLFSRATPA